MKTTHEPVLTVDGLVKHYGPLHAVDGLTFSVEPGEIFGILGPNGAGKSTSLECILGTKSMDKGRIRIMGLDPVQHRRAVFARTGVQFQDSAWQNGIRVGEICAATACLYDPEPDWRPLLEKFDLAKRERAQVSTLSGGERQKLSILLACMHAPEIVFLDELTAGLDPLARRDVWKFIRGLSEEGTAVVLTSHYMDEVETLCKRGLMLKNGAIAAEGSIGELIETGKGKNLDEAYVNIMEASV
ncbi:MAG: ABC transporter ATP-binding protein [Spirochaetales bacterium]|nr:ABC transporter ATP-binding protein [Spirochaetales bacterium]